MFGGAVMYTTCSTAAALCKRENLALFSPFTVSPCRKRRLMIPRRQGEGRRAGKDCLAALQLRRKFFDEFFLLDSCPGNVPDNLLPRVAIVGRPNVGKSALFNRLVGGNKAIVVDEPGVTRDRLYGRSFWGDYEFMVVDTGGVLKISKSQDDVMAELAITKTVGMDGIPLATREAAIAKMPSQIERQATAAMEEASVIIFVVDGQAGLTAADEEIADWLRKSYSEKCVILAVNKCESPRKGIMQASEFWSLGQLACLHHVKRCGVPMHWKNLDLMSKIDLDSGVGGQSTSVEMHPDPRCGLC
ncbi:GTP binding domain [Dillenia turbinata]|uniref:GTP binding domain n=1 Tax=Dillenia turbinata TaxID=194707 RepID=A0AAN8UZ37_9MAGN